MIIMNAKTRNTFLFMVIVVSLFCVLHSGTHLGPITPIDGNIGQTNNIHQISYDHQTVPSVQEVSFLV